VVRHLCHEFHLLLRTVVDAIFYYEFSDLVETLTLHSEVLGVKSVEDKQVVAFLPVIDIEDHPQELLNFLFQEVVVDSCLVTEQWHYN